MKITETESIKKCSNSQSSHHAFRPDELSVTQLNLSDLKDNLPLELDSIPIAFDRRASRHC